MRFTCEQEHEKGEKILWSNLQEDGDLASCMCVECESTPALAMLAVMCTVCSSCLGTFCNQSLMFFDTYVRIVLF